MCVQGEITTSSSKIIKSYESPYDATVIEKLKKAGAIIVGKTNMDEFAMGSSTENSALQVTKNPHDVSRVPGGSSGGSAVAVAAGMVPWALGSDTGGSIRQPAAFCGIVGLKPTYGRVSRYGLMAMASSYDQIGPLVKTVEDASIVLDEISGKDIHDDTTIEKESGSFFENLNSDLKGKKIGIMPSLFEEGLDERIKKNIEERIEWAKGQGAEIIEIDVPHIKDSLAVYYLMIMSEISSNLARFDGIKYGLSEASLKESKSKNILDVYFYSRELGFGPEVKRRIILGTHALSAGYSDAYYKKSQKVRELIKHEFKKVFNQVDAIIMPTTPTLPFKIGEKSETPMEMYLADVYTVPVNVAMLPGISIPAGTVEEDGKELPVGMQLISKWWDEQTLLNIAVGFEKFE
jgi:aspartyl-tRNA(Asn)/glutamyl-tRNA(Gln) amidotransferase subunit A